MMSIEFVEKMETETWSKPVLLSVSADDSEAQCPDCVKVINEQYPPQDSRYYPFPKCPHCSKPLDIQCCDIDEQTRFSDMNAAQYLYALEKFRMLGGVLMKLASGRYQVLFAGTRRSFGADMFVLWAFNKMMDELKDMKGDVHYA